MTKDFVLFAHGLKRCSCEWKAHAHYGRVEHASVRYKSSHSMSQLGLHSCLVFLEYEIIHAPCIGSVEWSEFPRLSIFKVIAPTAAVSTQTLQVSAFIKIPRSGLFKIRSVKDPIEHIDKGQLLPEASWRIPVAVAAAKPSSSE
eukprot:2259620-Amphidinium_carterae.1